MNEDRTCANPGTNLTQRRSRDVLRVKRNAVGRETVTGHLLSNLIGQRPWLNDDSGDRSWAKHPTQNLPSMMSVQVEALARGK